jgi:hypothetical protein
LSLCFVEADCCCRKSKKEIRDDYELPHKRLQ